MKNKKIFSVKNFSVKNFSTLSHMGKHKAFTLVELLISIIIIGILASVMFQVYITISNISLRIESEKLVQSETMFFIQTMQNIADSEQVDLTGYANNGIDENDLKSKFGLVDKLYLTGGEVSEIYLSGSDCNNTKKCYVEAIINGTPIQITDPKKAYFGNLKFKLTSYSGSVVSMEDTFQQGIGVYGNIYVTKYNKNFWPLNVKSDLQTFFSVR